MNEKETGKAIFWFIQIALIILKIAGVIKWNWLVVLSPTLIPIIIIFVLILILMMNERH